MILGYKKTDIGFLPEEWNAVPLHSIGRFKNGINKGSESFGHGTAFVNLMDVFGVNKIDSDEGLGLVETTDYEQKIYNLKLGDVLFIRSSVKPSGVGLTAVIEKDIPKSVYSGFLLRFRDDGVLDTSFKRYCFYSEVFRRNLINASSVSANTNINQDNLKKLLLALPPTKKEQRAIAEALSEIDALLESLDRLIAKKRNLKQAVMQQLLTGQTRLPGFSGEWLRTELKHLVSTPITDGPHLTPTFFEIGVPFLSVNNLTNNRIDLTDLRFISRADDEIFSRKCKPRKGDVLLGKAASVGKVAIVEDDLDFNIWSPIALVRSGETLDAKFLYFQLLSADSINQVTLLTNSSSQGNIGMGDIEKIQISYPCFDEQIAISKVLTSMDMEISAIESRRNKTAALKRGMMQELLSGRTRLI